MPFRSKTMGPLLAAAAILAAPTAALAHEQPESHEHAANEVADSANAVAASANQLQQEADALGATTREADDAADASANRDAMDRDDDNDDDSGKWGWLGLLGLAGLLGLKRGDRDIEVDRRRTATDGRTTTDRDGRL